MIKRIFFAAALVAFSLQAPALNVTVTDAGTLISKIKATTDPATMTDLTVVGPIDAEDMVSLGLLAHALQSLDLTNASITAYSGKLLMGSKTYDANVIPDGAFAGLTKLTSVKLPDVKGLSIGAMAFAQTGLESTPDLKNVISLGEGAFAGCASLKLANLSGIKDIAPSLFKDCTALVLVQNSNAVETIGSSAFRDCSSLANFPFGGALKSIGDYSFAGTGLSQANLAQCQSLSTVGQYAFANCPALTQVSFNASKSVSLGNGVFFNDKELETIDLPALMDKVPLYAFTGDDKLVTGELPDAVTEIGDYALKNNGTAELTLPASLTHIGTGAMENMNNLTTLRATALQSVPTLGDDVWAGVDQANIVLEVPDNLKNEFKSAEQWKEFKLPLPTDVGGITAEDLGDRSVSARFVGSDLQLKATGASMTKVEVFDVNGALIVSAEPNTDFAVIDTSVSSNPLFVVRVTTDKGQVILKLRR